MSRPIEVFGVRAAIPAGGLPAGGRVWLSSSLEVAGLDRMVVLFLVSCCRLAAPRQEEKIWHDQSVRVIEVFTDCLVQLV